MDLPITKDQSHHQLEPFNQKSYTKILRQFNISPELFQIATENFPFMYSSDRIEP